MYGMDIILADYDYGMESHIIHIKTEKKKCLVVTSTHILTTDSNREEKQNKSKTLSFHYAFQRISMETHKMYSIV